MIGIHVYFEVEINLFCEVFLINFRVLMHSAWPQEEFVYRRSMLRMIGQYLNDQRKKGLFGLIVFNAHYNMFAVVKFYVSLAQLHELSIWADEKSKRLFDALDIEDTCISKILTENPANAGIHILSDDEFENDVRLAKKKKKLGPLNYLFPCSQNLLQYLGHMDRVHHILAFRTSIDNKGKDVSLVRPFYNRFPLCIFSKHNNGF